MIPASASVSNTAPRALGALDGARWQLYRILAPRYSKWFVDREQRVWVLMWFYAGLSFFATLVWPLGLLAFGPILWGIPHVMADIRYLVLNPGHHRQTLRLVLVSLALLASVLGAGILAGAVAIALAGASTEARWSRRSVVIGLGAALFAVAWFFRRPAELVLAHAHNWVAVVWLMTTMGNHRRRWFAGAGLLGLASVLFVLPISWISFVDCLPGDMTFGYHIGALAPGDGSSIAIRAVLVFTFAQAFHYAVWLRLMPELLRERKVPRSFSASYLALQREFGKPVIGLVTVGMVALAVSAAFALREAREAYLRFALFHGYLELAFAAIWWLSKRPEVVRRSASCPN